MLRLWRNNHKDTPGGREALAKVRTLLKHEPRLSQGLAAEELARPVPKKGKPSKQSYKPSERDQVLLAAERQFRAALLRIRENTTLLARYRAGSLDTDSRDGRIGRVLECIAATGDLPRDLNGEVHAQSERLLRGKRGGKTWGRLFLSRQELTALGVMMTDRYGWNLSVFDRLHVPVTTPSAGETAGITYEVVVEKRRSGEGNWFDTENYTDSGADSPGRLITQALEATQHGRSLAAALAPATDWLMVARNRRPTDVDSNLDRPRPLGPLVFGVSKADARVWASSHQIGSPFQRARRTTVTTTGKPLQHKPGTHESVYVLPDENVREAAVEVIAAGAEEALDRRSPRAGPRLHLRGAARGRGRPGSPGDRDRGLRRRGDQPLAPPERRLRRRLPALPVLRERPGPPPPPSASRTPATSVAFTPVHLAREALAQAMGRTPTANR